MNHLNMTYISRIALSQERPCHILLFAIASVTNFSLPVTPVQRHTTKQHAEASTSEKPCEKWETEVGCIVLSKMQIGYDICFYMIAIRGCNQRKNQCENQVQPSRMQILQMWIPIHQTTSKQPTAPPTSLRNENRSRTRWTQKTIRSI